VPDSERQTTSSPRLPALADKDPTPEPASSTEVTEEVDKDWEAEENLADEDISRFKADEENAGRELEMAEERIPRLKTDMENAEKGLEVAEECKRISAGMRKRKQEWRTQEEEAMEKLRRLSGHPSPRTDASQQGLMEDVDSPSGG